MRMLNRNPKRLSAEVFSSAQKQPKQNASSQNREENGSTTLRNTREKPLLAGYRQICETGNLRVFLNSALFLLLVGSERKRSMPIEKFGSSSLVSSIF